MCTILHFVQRDQLRRLQLKNKDINYYYENIDFNASLNYSIS